MMVEKWNQRGQSIHHILYIDFHSQLPPPLQPVTSSLPAHFSLTSHINFPFYPIYSSALFSLIPFLPLHTKPHPTSKATSDLMILLPLLILIFCLGCGKEFTIVRDIFEDPTILDDYQHSERIPKVIHYIWVGPNPKSDLVLQNIKSWRKYCPDFFIIEWNDYNLYKINLAYLEEAYQEAHYAYVADYFRLYLVHRFGGIYIDSDVELLRPIDEFTYVWSNSRESNA